MAEEPEPEHGTDSAAHSVEMLKAVIDGATYETVAAQFGVTRTAVERRIKTLAIHLSKAGSIKGLNEEGAAFVRRLRQHRDAILAALAGFEPPAPFGPRETRVVSSEETGFRITPYGKRKPSRSWNRSNTTCRVSREFERAASSSTCVRFSSGSERACW